MIESSLPLLLDGLSSTVLYSLASIALGFVIALAVCAARLAPSRMLRAAGALYVSALRGIPLIVQLLIAYYCLPQFGIDVSPSAAAILTLAACTAAYQAEILRGGFLGVPYGQIEAARMSDLTGRQIFLFIQVPQAVRLTLPSLMNEAITMVKASSLVSVVGVLELTRVAQNIAASTFKPLPIYALAGAAYLLVTLFVDAAGRVLERKLGQG